MTHTLFIQLKSIHTHPFTTSMDHYQSFFTLHFLASKTVKFDVSKSFVGPNILLPVLQSEEGELPTVYPLFSEYSGHCFRSSDIQ